MSSYLKRLLVRLHKEDAGITALETAIILIAFVVVASVFAFTMLSAGTFSTERGKEAVYAGLAEVRSSMEVKGSVLALASTAGQTGTITSLVVTVGNAMGGEPIDMTTGANAKVLVEYRDASQRVPIDSDKWSVNWRVSDNDNLLETGELAEITIDISTGLTPSLTSNTQFALEIKPPSGAVLNIQRTTPAYIEQVNDLQ
jgi:flagellin FlaB